MDQAQFANLIRYRGPSVTTRQALFERANADLERAFAVYLAQPPVNFDDDAYLAANDQARAALGDVIKHLSHDGLLACNDDRVVMRDLILRGGINAANRAESFVRSDWQDAHHYATALVEIRTWINLAILADLWPAL